MSTAEQTQAKQMPAPEFSSADLKNLQKYLSRMNNGNDGLPGEALMLVIKVNRILETYGRSLSDLADHAEWLLGQGGNAETLEMLDKYVEEYKKLKAQNTSLRRENEVLRVKLNIPSPAKNPSERGDHLTWRYMMAAAIFPPALALGAALHKEVRSDVRDNAPQLLFCVALYNAIIWGIPHLVDGQAVKRFHHEPKIEQARNSIVCPGDKGVVCEASFSATPYYLSWVPLTDKEIPAGKVYRKIHERSEPRQSISAYGAEGNLEQTKTMKQICQVYADVVSYTGLPDDWKFNERRNKKAVCSDFEEIKGENDVNPEMDI